MNLPEFLPNRLNIYKVTGKALSSTCGAENIERNIFISAKTKKGALKILDDHYWGSDEIFVSSIELVSYQSSDLTDMIKASFIEDAQFLRYFRTLFSELYDKINGKEIYIEDEANINNGKPILYEKVANSRLEYLMHMKSVLDFMIQEEKQEAEENNICLN